MNVARSLLILAVPVVVFVGGARLMAALSGREVVVQRLREHAAAVDRTPLNQRLHYDRAAVERQWGALNGEALAAEQRFLLLDLAFPLLYGAALLFGLLFGRAAVAPSLNPWWLVVPVAVTLVSDWAENLVQLGQLNRYRAGGAAMLQPGWIGVASVATALKLAFFVLASLAIVAFAVRLLIPPGAVGR